MTKKKMVKEIALWSIALFVALVCLRSGLLKVTGNKWWIRDFQRWGYPDWFRVAVGVSELAAAALLLVPRLATYGASLFSVIMLGAMWTHATHGEMSRLPFNALLLILSLTIAWFRRPVVEQTAAHSEPLPGRIS